MKFLNHGGFIIFTAFLGDENYAAGILPYCGHDSVCPFVQERSGQRLQTAYFAQDFSESIEIYSPIRREGNQE